MKQAIAFLLAFILLLTGCSGKENTYTTEPETEPATAPAEVPTEPTEPEETEPEETEPAVTEPEEVLELLDETQPVIEEEIESKSWIGLVMIAGTLTFLLAGAMIFRSVSRKNRY